jgi:DNA-binding transcriptional ArsR family regulator
MTRSAGGSKARVEFRATLPYRLTSFLALLGEAPRYEGFDQQVYVTHAELSRGLREDIELVFLPLGDPLIKTRLCLDSPAFDDFTSFIGWLAQWDAEDVKRSVVAFLRGIGGVASSDEPPSGGAPVAPDLEDEEAVRAFLEGVPDPWAERIRENEATFEQTIRLLRDPVELKARLVFILTQFWDAHGRAVHEACSPVIARSLQYHRQREYAGTATEVYHEVTGKQPASEESRRKFGNASRLIFVPSCFSGAYATFSCPGGDERTLFVVYNCRSSGASAEGRQEIVRDVFPALKALADETRLQIVLLLQEGELYAQQIVDRLDLSQSSVSRHLSLLVAGRVLSVRREDGRKFYRIDGPSMVRLIERLKTLSGKGGSD